MKVLTIGKVHFQKLCNLSPGTVIQIVNSGLELESGYYMILDNGDKYEARGRVVDLQTGKLVDFHPSQRCIIHQDAAIVLDPIER